MDDSVVTGRRFSIGGPLSPEVDSPKTGDTEGFYLLKKDSQRRITLTQVLCEDLEKIIEVWYKRLTEEIAGSSRIVLTKHHLSVILNGLRKYIPEQSVKPIEEAIDSLRTQLPFNETTVNQINFALYSLQYAVNEVLKKHNIKPHWMFALDDLVRKAVHAAIIILSPEQGHLIGSGVGIDILEDGSTSGVSTNSVKSAKVFRYSQNKFHESIEASRSMSLRLSEELLEAEKRYCNLLRLVLSERKNQIYHLEQSVSIQNGIFERNKLQSESGSATPTTLSVEMDNIPIIRVNESSTATSTSPALQVSVSSRSVDFALTDWLQNLGFDSEIIDKFIAEEYTKNDVLLWMSREDLRRLNLRGGAELRIWRRIVEFRHQNRLSLDPECPTDEQLPENSESR